MFLRAALCKYLFLMQYCCIFSASEKYINMDAMLCPGPLLQAGQHTFPFSFILTHNLPSSFEGQFGHVRYCVKVGQCL